MSSSETELIALLAKTKGTALAELERTEAAVFRFSHKVRAFLDAFPEDMPVPTSVSPHYQDHESRRVPGRGGGSWLHLVYMSRLGVEAWAARLEAPVETEDEPVGGGVYVSVDGVLDGLCVSVSCIEYVAKPAGGAA